MSFKRCEEKKGIVKFINDVIKAVKLCKIERDLNKKEAELQKENDRLKERLRELKKNLK